MASGVILPVAGQQFRMKAPSGPSGGGRPESRVSSAETRRPDPIALPSLAIQARNFGQAILGSFGTVMAGRSAVVTEVERTRRRAICVANRCGAYLESSDRCARCGCWARAKAWLSVERCPVGLW